MIRRISALKYLCILTIPVIAYLSLNATSFATFGTVIAVFFLIPFLELFIQPSETNLEKTEEELVKNDPFYDFMLYLMVPLLFGFLYLFLSKIESGTSTTLELIGHTLTMGILCGALGINVAHELGHRSKAHEKFMSKMLLMCSLYMHFYIEHNRGHHKHVSTPEDPASARYGEPLQLFWLRSIVMTYISAWKIEAERLHKNGRHPLSINNQMLQFQIIQLAFVAAIWYFFGSTVLLFFMAAALIGILQLETVNYIEHYGLSRKKKESGYYERVMPHHSWNSNHVVGRVMLFELSRHSDHHYLASRKYQILRHHENSPQMPTGYPGMMVLANFPPLWFSVMHRQIKKFNGLNTTMV
ncbi:MAG: alkane 1-monooxygenase [Cyclobacteriaceae bacterium]